MGDSAAQPIVVSTPAPGWVTPERAESHFQCQSLSAK